MTLDLFVEASRDLEAEILAERQAYAKVAVAGLWPFLALAPDAADFEHRLALAHSRITAAVDGDLVGSVLDGFRRDFLDTTAAYEPAGSTESSGQHHVATLQAGQQFFHPVQQRWITVRAAGMPEQPKSRDNQFGNPRYFEEAAEEGPATGTEEQSGYQGFPAGPDPWNPMNQQYPMQPSAWTVPPNAGWVERPMDLQPGAGTGAGKSASRPGGRSLASAMSMARPASIQDIARNAAHFARYDDEGVETGPGPNPNYFDGGSEGVGGDQAGYPEDVALPEPNDRVNYYGTPSPQSSGTSQGGAQPYSNPGVPSDSQGTRQAVRHTAPGGGEHAPYEVRKVDGGYAVFNAKGERKNEDPKTEEEARRFQKALYKNVPGARESAEKAASRAQGFHDPRDRRVRVLAQDDMGTGAAPPPPQSMMPGGPGSMAGEPMMPGASSSNPSVMTAMDPGGADAASQANGRQVASRAGGGYSGTAIGLARPAGGQGSQVDWQAISRAAATQVRDRPTDLNPSGVPDEFDDNTWDEQARLRPRQPADQRGVNTPQTSRDPIPQASSSDFLGEQEEEERR